MNTLIPSPLITHTAATSNLLFINNTHTQLDVARTRIMIRAGDIKNQDEQQTEEMANTDPFKEVKNIAESEGPGTLFAGLVPRAVRALTSGGIQFASYELTQNALLKR
jgi:Mitochondrial carrier protein